MITSTLDNLHWYTTISPHFAKAIAYALSTDFGVLPAGRYEIDGEHVFALVNEYTTRAAADCNPEAHQAYADIQIMITGAENFGYTPLSNQQPSAPYSPDNDVSFYDLPEETINYITLKPRQFIIFFPSDIHQPEVFVRQPAPVKKLVLKVSVR